MTTSSPSREQQITTAKERLLALLDGKANTGNSPPVSESTACPKCGVDGFKAEMWCAGCGYCPKAGFEGGGHLAEDEQQGDLSIWQFIPGWLWLLMVVDLALIAGSFYFSWAIGGHHARTLVSGAVLALSSLLIVVSHFRAYFATLSTTHSQGAFDIVMKPMMVWRAAVRGLPTTSYLFCSLAWGTTGAIMSVCVIGGLDYMSIHNYVGRDEPVNLPSASTVAGAVIKGASAMQTEEGAAGDMQSMMSAVQDAAADANSGGSSPQGIEEAVSQLANTTPMPDEADADSDLGEDPMGLEGEGTDEAIGEGGDEADDADGDADTEGDPADDLVGSNDEPRVTPGGPGEETDGSTDEGDSPETDRVASSQHASANESSLETDTLIASLPPGEVVHCAIVGFTVNASGEPRSLLLAAPISGNWRYITRLPIDEVPADVVADLTARFPEHRSPRPLVPCPFGGQWLTPDFFCEVHFPTSATGLRFGEPTFVEMQTEGQGGRD